MPQPPFPPDGRAAAKAAPRNLASPRARWRAGDPMRRHDALPAALRVWMTTAALPWSAGSALRLWQRALRETGSEAAALTRLRAAEAATLRREARQVWGPDYPLTEKANGPQ